MGKEHETAILDFVLTKAFTEGTLADIMHELWDQAYHVGYMDGRKSSRHPEEQKAPHARV